MAFNAKYPVDFPPAEASPVGWTVDTRDPGGKGCTHTQAFVTYYITYTNGYLTREGSDMFPIFFPKSCPVPFFQAERRRFYT